MHDGGHDHIFEVGNVHRQRPHQGGLRVLASLVGSLPAKCKSWMVRPYPEAEWPSLMGVIPRGEADLPDSQRPP